MQIIINKLEQTSELSGRFIAWLTLFIVLITFIVVVLRYVFDYGSIAMQESVTYLHAFVFMLGAAYTLKHDGHVRVDIFYRKMSARKKAWVDLLGTFLLLYPVCCILRKKQPGNPGLSPFCLFFCQTSGFWYAFCFSKHQL